MQRRADSSAGAVVTGDCVEVMQAMPSESVDLVLTDPPYLVGYQSRDGRVVPGDDNPRWLAPAFREVARVLKPSRVCVSFYGWNRADWFLRAWRTAGLSPIGHLVFVKPYASSARMTERRHECAYVLAKGTPRKPLSPLPDVIRWRYTGNRHHPTEKPISALAPIIRAFTNPGELVLDPFAGSGSTGVAAQVLRRRFIGVELTEGYARTANARIENT